MVFVYCLLPAERESAVMHGCRLLGEESHRNAMTIPGNRGAAQTHTIIFLSSYVCNWQKHRLLARFGWVLSKIKLQKEKGDMIMRDSFLWLRFIL